MKEQQLVRIFEDRIVNGKITEYYFSIKNNNKKFTKIEDVKKIHNYNPTKINKNRFIKLIKKLIYNTLY